MWYARVRIGSWQTGLFPKDGSPVDHRIDVSQVVRAPGTYVVTFDYTEGHEALEMRRVALVERSADGAEREVAVDAHTGRTGAWDVKPEYTLRLTRHTPRHGTRWCAA